MACNKDEYVKRKVVALNDHEALVAHGLDCVPSAANRLTTGFEFEPPARPGRANFHGPSFLGAFSYAGEGTNIYSTNVGRYCSIARQVDVGQKNHPTTWLSTSPLFYQTSFKIASGDAFEEKSVYDADSPPIELNKAAHLVTGGKETVIGNDVWLGFRSIVVNGVKIGDGTIVGAGSIVTKDLPPYSIAVGSPAKVIKRRFSDEMIERLLAVRWWDFAPWQLRHLQANEPERALEQAEKMREANEPEYKPAIVSIGAK